MRPFVVLGKDVARRPFGGDRPLGGRQKPGVREPSPHTHGVRQHFRQMRERRFAAFLSWMSFSVSP